jgi:hypothetical protein
VILIHGYSASFEDFKSWRDKLATAMVETKVIEVGNYITLNNEVTIKDLGEAFDRALQYTEWGSGSKDDVWTFDAIVHSTGMLVLRQWLASDPYERDDPRSRIQRLKHLVGFAPATFGSPQAQKGRSWLGALVKGNKQLGPDFLNAGDQVLDGLELGSRYTWDLAHKDMLCDKPLYDKGADTPYVTVFIGDKPYDGVAAVSNSPGTDGTVRWAGCALNARKVSIDFRREPKLRDFKGQIVRDSTGNAARYCISEWENKRLDTPVIAVRDRNHGTIIAKPDDGVADLVTQFLQLSGEEAYLAWEKEAQAFGADALKVMDEASKDDGAGGAGWQQLLVHVVDDHGDGVNDYHLQIFYGDSLDDSDKPEFAPVPVIADTYTKDNSYRCFYVRLSPEMLQLNAPGAKPQKMWLELIASSGSKLIEYEAYTETGKPPNRLTVEDVKGKPVKLDITDLATGEERLLFPYTTTLLEVFVEREPMPLGAVSEIFTFPDYSKKLK